MIGVKNNLASLTDSPKKVNQKKMLLVVILPGIVYGWVGVNVGWRSILVAVATSR